MKMKNLRKLLSPQRHAVSHLLFQQWRKLMILSLFFFSFSVDKMIEIHSSHIARVERLLVTKSLNCCPID